MTRSVKIEVRLSPEEEATIAARANEAGVRLSEFVRRAALGRITSDPRPVSSQQGAAERAERPAVDAELSTAYRCPVVGCDYAARSPAAVCTSHGRKVRPPS
jgi:hypothetical protein